MTLSGQLELLTGPLTGIYDPNGMGAMFFAVLAVAAQLDRNYIRDNLLARITEAEREGWLGEIEGLEVSLAGAQDKLAQLDAAQDRSRKTIDLGMPSFTHLTGCTFTATLS